MCGLYLLKSLKVNCIAYSPFPLSHDTRFCSVEVLMSFWHSLG